MKNNIEEYPQNFGFLFEKPEQIEPSALSRQTQIEHYAAPHKCIGCDTAIIKFVQKIGVEKVFEKNV